MPCGCGAAAKEIMEYHNLRGFCESPNESNYEPTGLARITNAYLPSNNRENYN